MTTCRINGVTFDFGAVDTDIDVVSIHDNLFQIQKKELYFEPGRRTEIVRVIDGVEIPFTRAWGGERWIPREKIKSIIIQGKEVKKLIFPEDFNETHCAKVSFYENKEEP